MNEFSNLPYPVHADESESDYYERIRRYEVAAAHCDYVVIVHSKTLTPGLRGVEVIRPNIRPNDPQSYSCNAITPLQVRNRIMRSLQELINMGGPMATMENTWVEIDGCAIILGEPDEREIFNQLKLPEPDIEPIAHVVLPKNTEYIGNENNAVTRMVARIEMEKQVRAARKKAELDEFNRKKETIQKKEARKTNPLGVLFG